MRKFISGMLFLQHFWQTNGCAPTLVASKAAPSRILEYLNIAGQRGWRWEDKQFYCPGTPQSPSVQGTQCNTKMATFTPRTGQDQSLLDFCHHSVKGTWGLQQVNPVQEQEAGTCKLHASLSYSSELWNADDEASLPTKLKSLCWFIHKTNWDNWVIIPLIFQPLLFL